jgi:hypothetical protein
VPSSRLVLKLLIWVLLILPFPAVGRKFTWFGAGLGPLDFNHLFVNDVTRLNRGLVDFLSWVL